MKTTSVIASVRASLNDGEVYAGIVIGKNGADDHHLILLPGEVGDVNWTAAKAWAAEQGGELPTRREQSLLYANASEEFKRDWYWSSEEDGSGWAWCQGFYYGNQYDYYKDDSLRARAVRRLVI